MPNKFGIKALEVDVLNANFFLAFSTPNIILVQTHMAKNALTPPKLSVVAITSPKLLI